MRVLLPHEVLDSLAECSTDFAFSSIMLGQTSDQSRRDFWAHVATLEPWKDHPTIQSNDWNKLIGFHIHGDGCEFYREDEYFIWSWSSIFSSSGMIKDCLIYRFPIAVIPERQMLKAEVSRLLYCSFVCCCCCCCCWLLVFVGCCCMSLLLLLLLLLLWLFVRLSHLPGSVCGAQDHCRADLVVHPNRRRRSWA